MDIEFNYTIIILNYKKEVIESIFNQDIGFKDNVQLIILNGGKDYKSVYPKNITIIKSLNDITQDIVKGRYLYFTRSNLVDNSFLSSLNNTLEKDIIKLDNNLKQGTYNIDSDFKHHFLDIEHTFIRSDLIGEFDGNADFLINKSLLDKREFTVIPYDTIPSSSIDAENRLELYENLIGFDEYFIRYAIIKDLNDIILADEFGSEHIHQISKILQNIDDNSIKKHDGIDKNISKFLMYVKTQDFHHEITDKKLYLKTGNTVVNGLHGHGISLDLVDIIKNKLNVSGVFKSSCHPDFIDFEAHITYHDSSSEVIKASKYEYLKTGRGRKSYLGIDWIYSICFDFLIPLQKKKPSKIDFKIRYHEDGDEMLLHPKVSLNSNTCYISKYCSYIAKKSWIVLFKDNHIEVADDSFLKKARLELNIILSVIKSGEKNTFYSIYIRILYYIMYPFWSGKRIWLFVDRPSVADDNAKHLFSYAIKQNDNVKKYYLLDKDSEDFKKMKKLSKNIVALDSLKHKLLYSYAEKFISSQTAKTFSNPFVDLNLKLFSNMPTAERVFLQHGVTIHDVSHWFIKYAYNFVLLVTVSDIEKNSIIYPHTNFGDDVVRTLGFPRYDNLSNDDLKKQILFMPTWRKHIQDKETFLDSDYYKMINGFLNNSELLDFLDKNGFKLMFKPHFEMMKYFDLIDIPPEVELCEDVGYQELFNSSMLLITDYSSVFFDFAYLKKPIIYYRAGDEYHNKSGYFDFDQMGFGDIINTESELIDKINKYFENSFKMEEKYVKRVDEFFKYTDKNNCKRVYGCLYNIK